MTAGVDSRSYIEDGSKRRQRVTTQKIEVLYSSSAILSRLKFLLGEPSRDDRRVVLVAYVGDGARAYLPSPNGLRVICNPSAGGTSARVLRELRDAGARVQLSGKLHAKVFWSEERGCIIGSANASTSALGVGGLKEAAVLLPPGMVDIDKLIAHAAPADATEAALARLQKEIKDLPRRFRPESDSNSAGRNDRIDFGTWFESANRGSDPWKLGWWTEASIRHARSAIVKAKTEYGVAKPSDYFNAAYGTVSKHDWLLCFDIDDEDTKSICWLFVDFVVSVSPSDKGAYDKACPFQAIQVHPLKKCPSPPFQITQPFRKAFRRALRDWGVRRIRKRRSLVPAQALLKETHLLFLEERERSVSEQENG